MEVTGYYVLTGISRVDIGIDKAISHDNIIDKQYIFFQIVIAPVIKYTKAAIDSNVILINKQEGRCKRLVKKLVFIIM